MQAELSSLDWNGTQGQIYGSAYGVGYHRKALHARLVEYHPHQERLRIGHMMPHGPE